MGILSVILLACALAADAFAVSLCKGFSVKKVEARHCAIVGLYFGGFQALMPLLGYFLGVAIGSLIATFDHFIAFGLLALIGAKMIYESFSPQTCEENSAEFGYRAMLPLAVATSIDALAVGVSLAIEGSDIVLCATIIGVITALLSIIALKIGNRFGLFLGSKASLLGGIILIALGAKILWEHLG